MESIDASRYNWVSVEMVVDLSTEAVIDATNTVVGCPSNCSIIHVDSKKGFDAPLMVVKFHFTSVYSLG